MPIINVKLFAGVFSHRQKKEIVARLTDAMASIDGEYMRSVTWVVIEEIKCDDWAFGGKTLNTVDVKASSAGRAVQRV